MRVSILLGLVIWAILALLVWGAPGRAQPAGVPPARPAAITLSAEEVAALIDDLANAPARWSFRAIQLLLARQQEAARSAERPMQETR